LAHALKHGPDKFEEHTSNMKFLEWVKTRIIKKPTVLEELERQKRPMAFSRIRHGNAWISKAQVLKKKGPWTLQKQHDPR